MTKSRKVGILLALTLFVALFASNILPLSAISDRNTASAVTVTPRDEWENTYSGTYYNNLNTNQAGTAFRSDLASLITSTHKHQTGYDELKTVYKTSDADPNKKGNIIWFYTGTSAPYDGSLGSSYGDTNREHVWAKNGGSTYPKESGPGADAHHLRPLEATLNSKRSNYGFGVVAQNSSTLVKEANKSDYGPSPDGLCYLSGGLFYPAKGYRGATARILFYMEVRWGTANGLYFVDGTSTSDGKGIGKISDLMKWHLEEPPTDEEIRRNNVVADIQGNRNPFIDHPEYAEMIYCNTGASYSNKLKEVVNQCGGYLNSNVKPDPDKIPTAITLSQTSLALTVGNTSSKITVTATPSTASNEVNWTSSNSSVATVSDGVVTAKAEGTATITATSKYDSNVKATLQVTVNPVQLTGITISPNSLTLKEGTGQTLTATPTPSNAKMNVTWSSSNTSVATVSSNGYVTAVAVGTATITATDGSTNIKASITVTVQEAPKPAKIEIVGTPNKTEYIQGEAFDPTGLTVKVTYSDNSYVNFTGNDLLQNFQWLDGVTGATTLTEGTTTVTCKYGSLQATVTGIIVTNNIDGFINKMAVIESADFDSLTLEQQFEAIKQAVEVYNKLTTAEKAQANVVGKYATLRQAAADYNEAVRATNDMLADTAELATNAISKTIKSMSDLIKALINALFGR